MLENENVMIKRLKKENITIIEHEEENLSFAFNYDNTVLVPKREDLKKPESQYSMAHELGHIYQFKESGHFKKRANMQAREHSVEAGVFHSLLFSLFLLFIELDAWIKGYLILKEEGIFKKSFFPHAWKCYKSYLKNEARKTIKYVLPFYPAFTLLGVLVTTDINWGTFWLDSFLIFGIMILLYEFSTFLFFFIETRITKKRATE